MYRNFEIECSVSSKEIFCDLKHDLEMLEDQDIFNYSIYKYIDYKGYYIECDFYIIQLYSISKSLTRLELYKLIKNDLGPSDYLVIREHSSIRYKEIYNSFDFKYKSKEDN